MSALDPLEPVEKPLASVAEREFKKLPHVKNLGQTVSKIIARVQSENNKLKSEEKKLLSRLAPLFSDFDDVPLPMRRQRVERALFLLEERRQGRLWKERPKDDAAAESLLEAPAPQTLVPEAEASDEPAPRERELANRSSPQEIAAGAMTRALEKLATEVMYVKGVGPKLAQVFSRLGIETVEDLLWHIPHRYEDRRHLQPIASLESGRTVVVRGRISGAGRSGRSVYEALLSDESGHIYLKWFRFSEKQLRDRLAVSREVVVAGEVKRYRGRLEIHHPDIEDVGEDEGAPREAIVPVYPLTEGLHNKRLRAIAAHALDKFGSFLIDALPPDLLGEPLPDLARSIAELHRPQKENDVGRLNARKSLYHRRIRLHEAFFLQLGLLRAKAAQTEGKAVAFERSPELLERFLQKLPFTLTRAQKRVIDEIAADLSKAHPMNRLLQGDVGSGKTVVAAAAALIAVAGGCQAALMAPTEVLAEQHYRNLRRLLEPLGLHTALLTSSQKISTLSVQPARVRQAVENGEIALTVGTHALIQEHVNFKHLALAVIDEQHRFGVAQRAELRAKGEDPHVLVMTATPIPRTLTLTVYGDLDVSVLDEMPPGREPPKTVVYPAKGRREVWRRVKEELDRGRQAYVVYPLVAESEKLDLRNAEAAAEELEKIFADKQVGLVHGRMKSEEKDEVLSRFRDGALDILVSTTVIEVGIDVPNASVMVVEHAERFGLSQLHQLRGRVGRGGGRAYCFLVAGAGVKPESVARLDIMARLSDGFAVAEEDLKIRGPGEFMGTRQSGLPDFRALDLLRDQKLLAQARQKAQALLAADPDLSRDEHAALARLLAHHWHSRARFVQVG